MRHAVWGCGAFRGVTKLPTRRSLWKGAPKKVTVLYPKVVQTLEVYPSRASHVKPGLNLGGPPPKAKYSLATDSELSSASER